MARTYAWLDAKRAGARKYESTTPCRCGSRVRYTSSRLCAACTSARTRAFRAARRAVS